MNLEEECRLSFYKEIAMVNDRHGVFLVQHTETKELYVKKVLRLYDVNVYRYLLEHHIENTPHILEVIEDEGRLIIIEEYIKGKSLAAILDEKNITDEKTAVRIIKEICMILSHLHGAKPPIIHRDIKPSNIILSSDGVVKLLDMDAAKSFNAARNRDTHLMGTAGYAAPEQYGFGVSDEKTDIYATGVLFNVMLTGEYPQDKMAEAPYGSIVKKCIRLDQSDRFSSARELYDALSKIETAGSAEEGMSGNNMTSHAKTVKDTERLNLPGESMAYLGYHLNDTGAESLYSAGNTGESNKKIRWNLPAGFRTLNPIHMLFASIGYVILIIASLTLSVPSDNPAIVWLNRITMFVILFLIIMVSTNWFNIWRRFKDNRKLKIVLIIIADFLIAFILSGAMHEIENIILK